MFGTHCHSIQRWPLVWMTLNFMEVMRSTMMAAWISLSKGCIFLDTGCWAIVKERSMLELLPRRVCLATVGYMILDLMVWFFLGPIQQGCSYIVMIFTTSSSMESLWLFCLEQSSTGHTLYPQERDTHEKYCLGCSFYSSHLLSFSFTHHIHGKCFLCWMHFCVHHLATKTKKQNRTNKIECEFV